MKIQVNKKSLTPEQKARQLDTDRLRTRFKDTSNMAIILYVEQLEKRIEALENRLRGN